MPDNPYARLAHKLRKTAREEAVRASPPTRRGKVIDTSPITVLEYHNRLTLEDGDDDVTVAQSVYDYDERFGLQVDDEVLIDEADGDYVIRTVISDTSTAAP